MILYYSVKTLNNSNNVHRSSKNGQNNTIWKVNKSKSGII